jgi:hypothetical protein
LPASRRLRSALPSVVETSTGPAGLFIRHPKLRGKGRLGCFIVCLVAGVGGGVVLAAAVSVGLGIGLAATLLMCALWAARSPAPYGITLTTDEVTLEHRGLLFKRERQSLPREQWIDLWLERPNADDAKIYFNARSGPSTPKEWTFTFPLYWGGAAQIGEFNERVTSLVGLRTSPAILINMEPSWKNLLGVLRETARQTKTNLKGAPNVRRAGRGILIFNNIMASFQGRANVEAMVFDTDHRQMIHHRPPAPSETYPFDDVVDVEREIVTEGERRTHADDPDEYLYRYHVILLLRSGSGLRLHTCFSSESKLTKRSAALQQALWIGSHAADLLALPHE